MSLADEQRTRVGKPLECRRNGDKSSGLRLGSGKSGKGRGKQNDSSQWHNDVAMRLRFHLYTPHHRHVYSSKGRGRPAGETGEYKLET